MDPSPPSDSDIFDKTPLLHADLLFVEAKSTRRIGCLILVPTTLILILLSAGLGTVFLFWLSSWHSGTSFEDAIHEGAFLVNEGNRTNPDGTQTAKLVGLTITTVTTHIVSATAPFLVGLSAYCTGSLWLAAQGGLSASQSPKRLPTPLQYGLLFELAACAGLKSIYDGAWYLCRSLRRPSSTSTVVFVAFTFTTTIYLTTHLLAVADLWLHTTTSATFGSHITKIPPDLNFGVAFNDSFCAIAKVGCVFPQPEGGIPVSDAPLRSDPLSTMLAEGSDIMLNSTGSRFSVILLHDHDDLAVIVPTTIDSSASWTASSFGIRARCRNITPQALIADTDGIRAVWGNLSATGLIEFDQMDDSTARQYSSSLMAVADTGDGVQLVSNLTAQLPHQILFPSDPPTMVAFFSWPSFANPLPNTFIKLTPLKILTCAFAECQMEFFNLTLRWYPSQQPSGVYSLEEAPIQADPIFMAPMWSPLLTQWPVMDLQNGLVSVVNTETNDANVMAAVSQMISRAAASMFAGTLSTVPVNSAFMNQTIILGRYPVAPVFTYAGILFIYSYIAFGIFLWAAMIKTQVIRMPQEDGGKEVTALELVQVQLTDPLVVVTQLFEDDEDEEDEEEIESKFVQAETSNRRTKPSVATDGLEIFEEDESTKRLFLALGESGLRFRVRDKLGPDEIRPSF